MTTQSNWMIGPNGPDLPISNNTIQKYNCYHCCACLYTPESCYSSCHSWKQFFFEERQRGTLHFLQNTDVFTLGVPAS